MYFSKFPHFLYDFLHKDDDENTKTSLVLDVTRNVRFKKDLLSNVTQYDEYDIVDGETPEIIAEKFYGTPHYHWIIMLANDLYDYRNDFPIPETVLQKYIKTYYNPTLHVDLKSYKIIPVSDITADNEYSYMYDPNEYHHSVIIFTPYDNDLPFDPEYLTEYVEFSLSADWEDELGNTGTWSANFEWPERDDPLDNGIVPYTQDIWQKIKHEDMPPGTFTDEIVIKTTGRERNPVYFIDSNGNKVDPFHPEAIGVSGEEVHRLENDAKRRIKIIDPRLIESLIRNFEQEM